MFWGRDKAANVMKTAIIPHNMIVEARRNGDKSELFKLAQESKRRGLLINENGEEREFVWPREDNKLGESISNDNRQIWARHMSKVHNKMNDEVANLAINLELLDHIWREHGKV